MRASPELNSNSPVPDVSKKSPIGHVSMTYGAFFISQQEPVSDLISSGKVNCSVASLLHKTLASASLQPHRKWFVLHWLCTHHRLVRNRSLPVVRSLIRRCTHIHRFVFPSVARTRSHVPRDVRTLFRDIHSTSETGSPCKHKSRSASRRFTNSLTIFGPAEKLLVKLWI